MSASAIYPTNLEGHLAIAFDAFRRGADIQTLFGQRDTRRRRPGSTSHLHQAQPAGADAGQSLEFAQGRHVAPLLLNHVQQRLAQLCGDAQTDLSCLPVRP